MSLIFCLPCLALVPKVSTIFNSRCSYFSMYVGKKGNEIALCVYRVFHVCFVSLPSMPGLRYVETLRLSQDVFSIKVVVLRDYIVVYVLTLRDVQFLSSRIYSHLVFFC